MNGDDCVARAEQLAPMIEAAAARMERERQLASEEVAALHEAGLFRMLLPRSLGGAKRRRGFHGRDGSDRHRRRQHRLVPGQALGCSPAAAYLDPAAAHEIFGAPEAVVAWGPPNRSGRARPVDGGYRATGTWRFASGSRHATWLGGRCACRRRRQARAGRPAGR